MEKVGALIFILIFVVLIHLSQKREEKKKSRKRTIETIEELLSGSSPSLNYQEIYETIAYDLKHTTEDFLDVRAIEEGFEVSYKYKRFSLSVDDKGYRFKNLGSHDYWLKHKEEILEKERKARDLKYILEYEKKFNRIRKFSNEQRKWIYNRDNGICQICFQSVPRNDYHADHIKPYSKGGLTTLDNGQCTHSLCNMSKGDSY